jgi:hypothetical protein
MALKEGTLEIRIISNNNAWKYGNWYKHLVEQKFNVMMYSITEDEYTVFYEGKYLQLPGKDIKRLN